MDYKVKQRQRCYNVLLLKYIIAKENVLKYTKST